MTRTSLQNMQSVIDPQLTNNWDVSFPSVPGLSDTRSLTYKAISTSIPGVTVEKVAWEGHGMRLHSAGRFMPDDQWECTFIETRDGSTRDNLLGWMNTIRNWKANSGSYKTTYAVPAELTMYDDIPTAVRSFKLTNAWPTAIGNVQLEQNSDIVKYNVTFAFDYVEEVANPT